MNEQEIDATYGPVQAQYRASRKSILVAVVAAAAFFVVGAAIATFALVFLRVPGARAMEQAGMLFSGGFLALFVPPLLLVTATRSALHDQLELRALGIVRRSSALGLKHCCYADVSRIEHFRHGATTRAMNVHATGGRLIGLTGFEASPEELAETIVRRAESAGASVARETRDVP